MRLGILKKVIREAQAEGDSRWETLLDDEATLRRALLVKVRAERRARGEPEPEPVVVRLDALRLDAVRPKIGERRL
jgi:hypothetical protein